MSDANGDAANTARFPFVDANPAQPGTGLMPFLPLVLSYDGRTVAASALLDTGATTNVLPYSLGEQLGLVWEKQRVPARGVVVSATVAPFVAPVRLAFAWTQSHDVPLLLGQTNFFLEFAVCFFRSRAEFEVRVAAGSSGR